MRKQRYKRLSNLANVTYLRMKKLIFESDVRTFQTTLLVPNLKDYRKTLQMMKFCKYSFTSLVMMLGDQALTSDFQCPNMFKVMEMDVHLHCTPSLYTTSVSNGTCWDLIQQHNTDLFLSHLILPFSKYCKPLVLIKIVLYATNFS